MVSERELLDAIAQCEKDPVTYANIEKLANLYIVHNFLYGQLAPAKPSKEVEKTIGRYGDSEFLKGIAGHKAEAVWAIMDELMELLQTLAPNLYAGVLRKLDT
jgi:hypothetical protein